MVSFAMPSRADAAGRVALVLVGEDYQKLQKSGIGAKRANDIAAALQAKGFEVLSGVNPVNSRARALLLDFSQKANRRRSRDSIPDWPRHRGGRSKLFPAGEHRI